MGSTTDITARRRSAAVTLRELGPDEHDVLDAVFAGLSASQPAAPLPRGDAPPRPGRCAGTSAPSTVTGTSPSPPSPPPAGAPIGIARLVGFGCGPPGRVELAVEVVDAWQRRGVGSRLVREVLARGRAAGHPEVVAEVLAENVAMQVLLCAMLPELCWVEDGPTITFRGRLGGPTPGGAAA